MNDENYLPNLKQLMSAANETDCKIWENNAYHNALSIATEKLNAETARMTEELETLQKEDLILESVLKDMDTFIAAHHQRVEVNQQSLINQQLFKDMLLKENGELRARYDKNIAEFRRLYDEKRTQYENSSSQFKTLQEIRNQNAQRRIRIKWLKQQTKNFKRSETQFHEIQKNKFQQTVVAFAQLYVDQRKAEEVDRKLQQAKKQERELLAQHIALQEELKKQKTTGRSMKKTKIVENAKLTILPGASNEQKRPDEEAQVQESTSQGESLSQLFPKTLQEFINRTMTHQVKAFNDDNSKVRILDVHKLATKKEVSFDPATTGIVPHRKLQTKPLILQTNTNVDDCAATSSVLPRQIRITEKIDKENKRPTVEKEETLSQKTTKKLVNVSQQEFHSKFFPSKGRDFDGSKGIRQKKVSQDIGNILNHGQSSQEKTQKQEALAEMICPKNFEGFAPNFMRPATSSQNSQIERSIKKRNMFDFSGQENQIGIFPAKDATVPQNFSSQTDVASSYGNVANSSVELTDSANELPFSANYSASPPIDFSNDGFDPFANNAGSEENPSPGEYQFPGFLNFHDPKMDMM